MGTLCQNEPASVVHAIEVTELATKDRVTCARTRASLTTSSPAFRAQMLMGEESPRTLDNTLRLLKLGI